MNFKLFAFKYKTKNDLNYIIENIKKINEKNTGLFRLEYSVSKKGKLIFKNKNHKKIIVSKTRDYFFYSLGFIFLAFIISLFDFNSQSISIVATIAALTKLGFLAPIVYFFKLIRIKNGITFKKNEITGYKLDYSFDEIILNSKKKIKYVIFKKDGKIISNAFIFIADNPEREKSMLDFFHNYAQKSDAKLNNQL